MQVLRGLEAMGVDEHEPYVQQAAEWLRMFQNPDGGWGETCGSYDDANTKGVGPSTPSQTAWAIMGLLAANDTRSDCVARGIAYLLRTQNKDGSWDEPHYTGTGFPRVLYHMYRQYFPLIALTSYKKITAGGTATPSRDRGGLSAGIPNQNLIENFDREVQAEFLSSEFRPKTGS
jgi:squalene-hopene/tetraprenyl-beta-curcumene cyclase